MQRVSAKDVFDYRHRVIFRDNFQSRDLWKWRLSEDDNYNINKKNAKRIIIVNAPRLPKGNKAVKFVVSHGVNIFRSEMSLPYEKGFNERWYGERILVPEDWVFDADGGKDIVIQWHAIRGNWHHTHPNLAIAIGNNHWFVTQNYGIAQSKPSKITTKLEGKVKPGYWASWVIHAKWSPCADGIIEIWKDGKLVFNRTGANVYSSIGVEYTPYFKTGIYHPEWHLKSERKRNAYKEGSEIVKNKVIYVTDIKVGRSDATFRDVVHNVKI